jgi:hypothetical protein
MSAARPTDGGAAVERGEVVASFSSLAEAQEAVRSLTEAQVPADRLTVLRHVRHRATGSQRALPVRRLAEAGLVGGSVGAMTLLLAASVGVSGTAASELTLATFLLGAACGGLAGVVAALVTGEASIESNARVGSGRYDLAVDPRESERAIVALRWGERSEHARPRSEG